MLRFECESIEMIDHNQESINYQKKLIKHFNISKIFKNQELSNSNPLSELPCKYNLILCTEVIEHVEQDDKLLKEISLLLKEDGFCIVSVPNGIVDKFFMRLNKEYMTNVENGKGHINFYTKTELLVKLKQNGLIAINHAFIASEYTILHFILVIFKIYIDEDTGEITSNRLIVKLGGKIVLMLQKTKLAKLLDYIIPRNIFVVAKKKI